MSRQSTTQDVTPSKWVQVDLGSVQHFNKHRALSAQRRAHAGRADPELPGRLHVRASSTSSTADDRDQDRHRPAEPARARTSATRCRSSPSRSTPTKAVAEARLYVAGLGAYEATVNGKPVTDTVLNPGVTNPLRSVEYGTYDVTDLVEDGDNTLGVALGNGQTNVVPAGQRRRRPHRRLHEVQQHRPVPAGTLTRAGRRGRHDASSSTASPATPSATRSTSTPATAASRLESRKVTAVDANIAHGRPRRSTRRTRDRRRGARLGRADQAPRWRSRRA